MKPIHGHNNTNSRVHVTWSNMKRRCLHPVGKEKTIYRNVVLCDAWYSFVSFLEWALSNGYTDKLTIDRINPTLGYCPENCRFVSYFVQAANRRITNKNTTGYVGVQFHKGRWRSRIQWKKKQIDIGRHDSKEEAAKARDKYIIKNDLPHTLSGI